MKPFGKEFSLEVVLLCTFQHQWISWNTVFV